jgi:glycosyltransferase involved in cell wall biosynthesis
MVAAALPGRASMNISVIVTTYNWPEALNLALSSLLPQSVMPVDVVVADDGSKAPTKELIESWRARLPCALTHYWQEDDGCRVARARNGAIAAARGDYLIFVDGDMVLHPRFVEDHRDAARPDCFIQGARPRLSMTTTAAMIASGNTSVSLFTPGMEHRGYALRNALLSKFASKAKMALGGVQGCNQSFWRQHLERINGFDERFVGWGPEDRELAARLLHIGVKRNYVRHLAVAYHLFHRSREPVGKNPLDAYLDETLRTRATTCVQGLNLHAVAPLAQGSLGERSDQRRAAGP